MGAPKARDVLDVRDRFTQRCAVVLVDKGREVTIPIGNVPKGEVMRAAKLVDPSLNGATLNTVAHLNDVRAWLMGVLSEPDASWYQDRRAAESKPVRTPAPPQPDDDATALAALIQRLAGSAVDEAKVRELINESVEDKILEAVAGLRPTVVKLPDRPEVKIEGRTHQQFERVLLRVQAGRNVYLTGTPGTGKTTLAEQCAEALELPFGTLSLSPQTSSSRVFGYMNAHGEYVSTRFRECYEHGGVFLFDEIDNGHPATVAEINQAIANGGCDFPDARVKRHDDFRFVAAANTWGNGPTAKHAGRFPLDGATLDRFVMIPIGVDERLERDIANDIAGTEGDSWCDEVQTVRRNVEKAGLQVFVTPRATYDGAVLLRVGASRDDVREECLRKGATDDQWRKMREGV